MDTWVIGKLSDIAEIEMGQSPAGEFCGSHVIGFPLLNGPTEFSLNHPKPVQFTNDPKKFSRVGDILFCVRGSTTGKMNWSDQVYAIGRGIAAIRHKEEKSLNRFVRAILECNLNELLASASGSTFPNVSRSDLNSINIDIPPLSVQRVIAEVLSSLDDKIDLLHKQNQTLEQMAETMYEKMILEKFEGTSTTLGNIILLFDNLRIPLSSTEREKLKEGQLYPYYGAATVMDYINKYIFEGDYVLIGEDGTVQDENGYPIIQRALGKFWVNNHTHVLQGKEGYSNNYLEIVMKNTSVSHIVTGAVQPKINQSNLKELEVVNPPVHVVENFSAFIAPLFDKRHHNKKQVEKLETLRDTLLPKLMSGAVRVK